MKLLRYGPFGQEKPGRLDGDGQIRDLSALVNDIEGKSISPQNLARLEDIKDSDLPLVMGQPRLGACIGNVGKFICIGLNYADHAVEINVPIPQQPVVFMKATSAVSGPDDPIIKPRHSTKLDWEVELAFVIGKQLSYADEAEAQEAIAGYFVCNDVSEREFQLNRGGQWDLGKGCDTFGPIGPWMVTRDELDDVGNLPIWLTVNGKKYQNGNTRTMIFTPAYIVSYLSQYMSLQPGDVVSTGTPPGVGLGQNPPVFLQVGDKIALGIQGLGVQHQMIISGD